MLSLYERLKSYEPLFDVYEIEDCTPIGEGTFGTVYKLRHSSLKSSYAAVKVISIPKDESDYRELKEKYHQPDRRKMIIKSLADNQKKEIEILEQLQGYTHIVNYKTSVVKQFDEGYDILILMEYIQSLNLYLREHEMTESEVIKLGIDICTALEVLIKENIIHRDIKPENIFYNAKVGFKLGDFGIARSSVQNFRSTTIGTPIYAAPEIYNKEKIIAGDNRSDIYCLGLVMYTLLNNQKFPFSSDESYNDEDEIEIALDKRMSKEPIPKLHTKDPKLSLIIGKACSFNRNDRYNNPTEMREALECLVKNTKHNRLFSKEFIYSRKWLLLFSLIISIILFVSYILFYNSYNRFSSESGKGAVSNIQNADDNVNSTKMTDSPPLEVKEILFPLNKEGKLLFHEGEEPVKVLRIDSIKYPWPENNIKPYGDSLSVRYWKVESMSKNIKTIRASIDVPGDDPVYLSKEMEADGKSAQLTPFIDGDMLFSKLPPSGNQIYRFNIRVKLWDDNEVYWFAKEFQVGSE